MKYTLSASIARSLTDTPETSCVGTTLAAPACPASTRPSRDGSGPFIDSRSLIVGRVARLTLLPGHAIPFSGISNRKLVSNGAEVKLVFSEGDLLIMTTGAALQDGSIGDIVRVRNNDSGVTVSGAVQPDGSVQVSGG